MGVLFLEDRRNPSSVRRPTDTFPDCGGPNGPHRGPEIGLPLGEGENFFRRCKPPHKQHFPSPRGEGGPQGGG